MPSLNRHSRKLLLKEIKLLYLKNKNWLTLYSVLTHRQVYTCYHILADDHTILSRTSEVLQCSEVFTGDAGETAIFPFVTHLLEEVRFYR